jgi:hypothetical protein
LCSIGIVWKDPNKRDKPQEVRFLGIKSSWKTAEGITLGTTLKELEQINGRAFKLMGFGWDYQGTFMNSNQGKLTYMDRGNSTEESSAGGKMLIRMQPAQTSENTSKADSYNTVHGDRELSSDLPAMQKLNPIVNEMIVYFP